MIDIEDNYTIGRSSKDILGSGTFGIVRRGFKDGKEYAIKMILKEEIRKNVGWEGIVQKEI